MKRASNILILLAGTALAGCSGETIDFHSPGSAGSSGNGECQMGEMLGQQPVDLEACTAGGPAALSGPCSLPERR